MGLAALDAAGSGVPEQRAHGYVLRLERLRELQSPDAAADAGRAAQARPA